jgi:hypothetical protein
MADSVKPRDGRSKRRENTSDHVARRGNRGRWLSGSSPNPGGRPKIIEEIKTLAREYTETAIDTLVHIAENGKQESARVAAASALLDRGWGKPMQPVSGEHVVTTHVSLAERRERALKHLNEVFAEPPKQRGGSVPGSVPAEGAPPKPNGVDRAHD